MIQTGTDIGDLKLRVITHELGERGGENGLRERLLHEIESTEWSETEKNSVLSALEDATRIHGGDMNGDQPKINHPLRVALRILSPHHFNVRDRSDLIVAALLHDTVEERPERWIMEPNDDGSYPNIDHKQMTFEELQGMREEAFGVIEKKYGQNVRAIDEWLTSDL